VNWLSRPAFGNDFLNVTFGNGVFLAENTYFIGPARVARIVTSADGMGWSTGPLSPPGGAALAYDTTRFIMVGFDFSSASNVVYTSANGMNWTTTNLVVGLTNNFVRALTFGGGNYVALSLGVFRSSNLLQWSGIGSSLPIGTARVFLSGDGKSVLAGTGPILVSTNGIDYRTNATTGTFGAGAFGTNTFILTSGGGSIVTSSNATTWTPRNTGGSSINGLAYGSNTFVAVGSTGDIRTSVNGTSWSGRFSGTTLNLNAVAYGKGLFVAVGANGTIVSSPDTTTWTIQDSGTVVTLGCVSFGNGIFFTVGDVAGVIRTSSDGVNWIAVDSHTSVVLNVCGANRGNLLAAGPGVLLSSLDGLGWRQRRTPFPGFSSVGTSDKTFVLLGGNAAVLESGELSPIGLFTPTYNAATGFRLNATGDAGSTAKLQKSTNLVDWTNVLTFTNSNARTPVIDSAATNSPRGFYRVVAP
jgi:hypothetical protein